MKKIKLFLTLLLAFVGVVNSHADLTLIDSAAGITDGKAIVLETRDGKSTLGYYFAGANAKSQTFAPASHVWVVEASATGTGFYLKRQSDGKYIGRSGETVTEVINRADAAVFTAVNPGTSGINEANRDIASGTDHAKLVRFVHSDVTNYLNSQATTNQPKYASGTDAFSVWYVYEYQVDVPVQYSKGAEITDLANLTDGKVVAIQMYTSGSDTGRRGWMYVNESNHKVLATSSEPNSQNYYFTLHLQSSTTDSKTFTIEPVRTPGWYFHYDSTDRDNHTLSQATSVQTFTVKHTTDAASGFSNYWCIKVDGTDHYVDARASDSPIPCFWNGDGTGNEVMRIYAAQAEGITFVYTDEYGNYFTKSIASTSGITDLAAYALSLLDANSREYYTIESVSPAAITEGVSRYNVRVRNNFPFNVSPAPVGGAFKGEADKWYALSTFAKSETSPSRYLTADDPSTSDNGARTELNTRALKSDFLWCFVKVDGTENVFDVYNLAKGAANKLRSKSSGNCTFNTTGTFDCEQFRVVKSQCTREGVTTNHFLLQNPSNANWNLGSHGAANNNANTRLAFWRSDGSQRDEGSTLYATPAEAMCDFGMDDNYDYEAGYLGAYEHHDDTNLTYTAWRAFNENNSLVNLQGLITAYNTPNNGDARLDIDLNKYYELIPFVAPGKCITANPVLNNDGSAPTADATFTLALDETSDAKALFQFVADKTGASNYDIKHVNSGLYFQMIFGNTDDNSDAALVATQPVEGDAYYLNNERARVNYWSLHSTKSTEKYINADLDESNVNIGGNVNSGEYGTGNNNALWLIREARNYTVNVKAAGWATIYLPFAITVSKDNEVYYATSTNETTMHLEAVASGTTVAANTGLLVAGQGDHTFAISYATGTTPTGNILTGVNASRQGYTDGSYYALANKTEGVGFYKSNVTTLPANKAIYVPQNPSVRGFAFDLGNGAATGITGLQSAEKECYYDLNGRLVAFPTTGIYVNSKGQKILVK